MNTAYDLLKVTESAALAAGRWIGTGRKKKGDGAAVDAMRSTFNTIDINGTIIIGEGEKDKAPMLYTGEKVGTGTGWQTDIAIDPVEGTTLMATGMPNAISVLGASDKGTMYNPGPSYYMKKIVVPKQAASAVDIDASPGDNLTSLARCLNKDIKDITVFILNKPRHQAIIKEITRTGAKVQLHNDGDVAGALMAVTPGSGIDIMMGTGGTPEGVISACAVRLLGGEIFGVLDPATDSEKKAIEAFGTDLTRRLTTNDFVSGGNIIFAATGITGGILLPGIQKHQGKQITGSLILDGTEPRSMHITTTHG